MDLKRKGAPASSAYAASVVSGGDDLSWESAADIATTLDKAAGPRRRRRWEASDSSDEDEGEQPGTLASW
jgi:hypothetical protein